MTTTSIASNGDRDQVWIVSRFTSECAECDRDLPPGSHILWLTRAPRNENNLCAQCGADHDPKGYPPQAYWQRRDEDFQHSQQNGRVS